ncbi:MAG: multiheme c-type cytochrome [Chloroflexota bacterium]
MRNRFNLILLVSLVAAVLVSLSVASGAAGQTAGGSPDLAVQMTATIEGDVVTYSISLRNQMAGEVADIYVAGLIPASATFKAATATPANSGFRGVESTGVDSNVAVWLSRKIGAGTWQGPFTYQVTLADAAQGVAHAWVHWRSPSDGVAMSAPVVPTAASTAPLTSAGGVEGYAGSEACKACHGSMYESWKNTLHAHMIRPAAKGDLSNAKADLTVAGAPKPDQYDWAFVIGGWYKEERYAYRAADGTFKTGEFEYNAPKKTFSLRKDSKGNLEALDWVNECGACHATGMDPALRQWSEINIGCEACHGPGATHAKDPGTVRMFIDKSSENCGKCHIRGRDTSGRVGYPVDVEYGKPSTLMAKFNPIKMTDAASVYPDQTNSSRHRQQYLDWSKSGHADWDVTCVTCHDPHKGSLTERKTDLRAKGDELCAKCHSDKTTDPKVHSGHSAQAASCASCHLPKVIASGSVSTHTFEAIAPAKTLQYGEKMVNSCTYGCHKTQTVQWADEAFKRIFGK